MGLFEKYKFTNKKHPLKSVMAVVLALIGGTAIALAVLFCFQNGGEASLNYALATVLSLLMAAVGLVLAIVSRTEPDRYYFFPDLGIVLNFLVLCAGGGILAMGLS